MTRWKPSGRNGQDAIVSLLQDAASLDPVDEMPQGAEGRALAVLLRRDARNRSGTLGLGISCFLAAAILFVSWKLYGPASPHNVARMPVGKQLVIRGTTLQSPAKPIISLQIRSSQGPSNMVESARRMHRERHIAMASRMPSAPKPRPTPVNRIARFRVWRTESEVSETVGYFSPAWLSTPPDQFGNSTLTAGIVAVPLRASTTRLSSYDTVNPHQQTVEISAEIPTTENATRGDE